MGNGGSLNWSFYSCLSWHSKHFPFKRCLEFLDGKSFNVWLGLWKMLGGDALKYHEIEQCIWNPHCHWSSSLSIAKDTSVSPCIKQAPFHLSLSLFFFFPLPNLPILSLHHIVCLLAFFKLMRPNPSLRRISFRDRSWKSLKTSWLGVTSQQRDRKNL